MVKYITLTDVTGQEVAIPLQGLAHIDTTNSVQLTLKYLNATSNPILIVIGHAADVTTHQWKLFMTQQVEKALASNWREVESKPTPPTAVSAVIFNP
jgi:hypothetical protein